VLSTSEPLCFQNDVPTVGSAIALTLSDSRVGTLGGYVLVDGKHYGITNHHVFFKQDKPYSYEDGKDKMLEVNQPPMTDLIRAREDLNYQLEVLRLQEEEAGGKTGNKRAIEKMSQSTGPARAVTESRLENLKTIEEKGLTIGHVYKTSGIRLEKRRRMDWALIKFKQNPRTPDESALINQLPGYNYRQLNSPHYLNEVGKIEGSDPLLLADIPLVLKQGLTVKEIDDKQEMAEQNNVKFGVWKFGRSTHCTYGIPHRVRSIYRTSDDLISEEWPIVDKTPNGNDLFSKEGDSGSLVWSTKGDVVGLLWEESTKLSSLMSPQSRLCWMT